MSGFLVGVAAGACLLLFWRRVLTPLARVLEGHEQLAEVDATCAVPETTVSRSSPEQMLPNLANLAAAISLNAARAVEPQPRESGPTSVAWTKK